MAYFFLIAGWLVAILCMVFLAADILRARGLKKQDAPARKRRLWPWRRRIEDEPVWPATDMPPPAESRFVVSPWIRPAGVIAILLWEVFWIAEIYEWSSQNDRPLQLPYFFLLAMMVGIPAVGYFISRKWLAPDPEEA